MKKIFLVIALIFACVVGYGQDYVKEGQEYFKRYTECIKIGKEYVLSNHPEYKDFFTTGYKKSLCEFYLEAIGAKLLEIDAIKNKQEIDSGDISYAKQLIREIKHHYMRDINNYYKEYLQYQYECSHQEELRAELNKVLEDI